MIDEWHFDDIMAGGQEVKKVPGGRRRKKCRGGGLSLSSKAHPGSSVEGPCFQTSLITQASAVECFSLAWELLECCYGKLE